MIDELNIVMIDINIVIVMVNWDRLVIMGVMDKFIGNVKIILCFIFLVFLYYRGVMVEFEVGVWIVWYIYFKG